jgi:hypothetical protein
MGREMASGQSTKVTPTTFPFLLSWISRSGRSLATLPLDTDNESALFLVADMFVIVSVSLQ